jgi:hypothetical protein
LAITRKEIAMELTTSELAELIGTRGQKKHPLDKYIGHAVFIRTVTHHHTGRVVAVDGDFMTLADAAWIANDGRFHDMLKTGVADEVEPFCEEVDVHIGAMIDITTWPHLLPVEQK